MACAHKTLQPRPYDACAVSLKNNNKIIHVYLYIPGPIDNYEKTTMANTEIPSDLMPLFCRFQGIIL